MYINKTVWKITCIVLQILSDLLYEMCISQLFYQKIILSCSQNINCPETILLILDWQVNMKHICVQKYKRFQLCFLQRLSLLLFKLYITVVTISVGTKHKFLQDFQEEEVETAWGILHSKLVLTRKNSLERKQRRSNWQRKRVANSWIGIKLRVQSGPRTRK